MARLTISISDAHHQQLRIRAAREGKTIGEVIEEALSAADEANRRRAIELTEKARTAASRTMKGMTDDEIEAWVRAEVEALRSERRAPATP